MKKLNRIFLFFLTSVLTAEAQSPEWYFFRPDKTGISGDYHQVVTNDCSGNIWTAGYMPFRAEGSVVRFNYADSVFTCWGNYDGYLPADRVYDIAFDHNDGVWVATNGVGTGGHGGIAHYNGSAWTQYTSLNTPMPEDNMRGITVDGNNNVWATFLNVNTNIGGVAKYNGTTWTVYTPANSNLQTSQVDKIKADAQNNIWIGTSSGLIKFDGVNWVLNLNGSNVSDVEYDVSTNKIYAVTDAAIHIYDGSTWSQISSANAPISATGLWAVDARGDSIIIATIGGTYLTYIYNGTNWFTHSETDHTYDARIDLPGNFWICGIGFLEKFDGNSWVRYTRFNTGLVDYTNNQVFADSKNRMWFANGEGGIQVFDCPKWEIYGKDNGGLFPSLQNMTTIGTSITEDSYGDIWMTYDGTLGYAIQIPGGDYKNYASWKLWDNTNAGGLFQSPLETEADDSGHVFMRLYSSTVQMYNHRTNTWTHLDASNSGLPSSGLLCMASRAGGKMYFGGAGAIYILDNGVWSAINFNLIGLPITAVNDIAFDHNNNMWLATEQGVYKYDGITWTNWSESNSAIAADHVTSIAFGNGDTVFIGAHNTQIFPYYGGISVYDGSSWTSFLNGSSPIAHKQVENLEMDALGNLWMITQSEGISVYKKGGLAGFDCIDTQLQSCSTTGIHVADYAGNPAISVYPNPFTNATTIEINLVEMKNSLITVVDITGRSVKNIDVANLQIGKNEIKIDLSGFSSGIYFCKINSDQHTETVKLIKN